MPNGDLGRQLLEQAVPCGYTDDINSEVTAFAFRSFITFARFQPRHQINWSAKRQSNLLVAATNTKRRLQSFLYDVNYAGQRLRWVHVPGMTLATQNDMRRAKRIDALERNCVVRLNQYLQPLAHASERRPQLARTRTLTIKRVIDKINERSGHEAYRVKGKRGRGKRRVRSFLTGDVLSAVDKKRSGFVQKVCIDEIHANPRSG